MKITSTAGWRSGSVLGCQSSAGATNDQYISLLTIFVFAANLCDYFASQDASTNEWECRN